MPMSLHMVFTGSPRVGKTVQPAHLKSIDCPKFCVKGQLAEGDRADLSRRLRWSDCYENYSLTNVKRLRTAFESLIISIAVCARGSATISGAKPSITSVQVHGRQSRPCIVVIVADTPAEMRRSA